MKLAIISPSGRKERDFPLLEESKKLFDTVLFIPFDEVRLEITNVLKVSYKTTDLTDFDGVFFISPTNQKEFSYILLRILEKTVYTPYTSKDFFTITNKSLLLDLLQKNKIPIRQTVMVSSYKTADQVIKNLKFPIIFTKSPKRRILIKDKQTLKGIMSLFKFGNVVILEKPIKPEKNIWCFVVDKEIVSCYEKVGEKRRVFKPTTELTDLVEGLSKLFSMDFFVINFLKTKKRVIVNNIILNPDFTLFQKITGKNVAASLLAYIKNKIEVENMSVFEKITSEFQTMIRRLRHL